MSEALYNKYRPQIFEDVVGQEHIERTLKNAIAADKISHAYIFTGPRGTGKTTTARLLSKALICEKGPTPDPDGTCEDCKLIASGEHPDVYELDAASRTGVENVREEIIGKVNYAPTRGRYKVYIIDEVHMLSTAAFNALLKTLEEPPDHVVFILCTTDPQKVPETILSRCQRFDFRRIASEELISRLGAICEMEGVRYEGDALDLIAHRAQGGMRDALTSLDQLIAFGEGEVTTALAERLLGSLDSSDLADIVRAIGERDAAACFRWTSEYMETGADLVQFVSDLTDHMRDMYVMSLAGSDVALEVTEAGRRELEVELSWYGTDRLARMLVVLGDLTNELKTSTNQRLSFEIALTRMVRPESDLTLAALAERIETLERALAEGAAVSGVADVAVGAAAGGFASGVGAANAAAVGGGTANAGAAAAGSAAESSFAQGRTAAADAGVASGRPQAQASEGAGEPVAETGGAAQAQAHGGAESSQPRTSQAAADVRQHAGAQPGPVSGPMPSQADAASSEAVRAEGVPADASSQASSALASHDASRLWESVLAHLKKVGPAYGVIFMNTAPSIADGRLTIAFDPSSDFAFKAAQKHDAREALEKAMARAGAEGMPYEIVKGEPGQAKPQPQQAEVRQQPQVEEARSQAGFQPMAQQSQPQPQQFQPQQEARQQQPQPQAAQPQPQAAARQDDALPVPNVDSSTGATPMQQPAAESDQDFQDFLESAFGEGIVIEEIQE